MTATQPSNRTNNTLAGLTAGLFLSVPTNNNIMRKIEAQMVLAVRDQLNGSERTWRTGNTEVTTEHVGIHGMPSYERYVVVRLHDNEIARFDSSLNYAAGCKGLGLNDAGWRTTTTKSRINALLACFTDDCVVYQRAGQWLISTTWSVANPWLGKDWVSYGWQDNHNCRRAEATCQPVLGNLYDLEHARAVAAN